MIIHWICKNNEYEKIQYNKINSRFIGINFWHFFEFEEFKTTFFINLSHEWRLIN
jgi:hypothetical protein